MRVSNGVIGALNVVTLLLSIPILGGGLWLGHRAHTDCERFLQRPLVVVGVFLLAVSLAGIAGSCCRVSALLWLYLLVTFLLIVLLLCFTVFAFVVTNRGVGRVVSGKGYKEYKLGDYSNWLQKRVEHESNWAKIKSCLQDSKVCRSLQQGNDTIDQFFRENLSPIQSGCCKPPSECGFTFLTPTSWNTTTGGLPSSNNTDCTTWSNNLSKLCFDCKSCKAGVLANLKHDWKKVAILNIIFLFFLVFVYSVGCCAFRNNRKDNSYPRWK